MVSYLAYGMRMSGEQFDSYGPPMILAALRILQDCPAHAINIRKVKLLNHTDYSADSSVIGFNGGISPPNGYSPPQRFTEPNRQVARREGASRACYF